MIESTSHAARAARGMVAAPEDMHPSGDERFAVIDKHLKRTRYAQDQLIETLHIAQDVFGYLDDDVLMYVARSLRLPPSMVLGVATFYQLFTFEQPGEHTFTVCTGTACYVKGADEIVSNVTAAYGILAGETTEDGVLTLKTARCIGSCSLAPMVLLDGVVVGNETPESVMRMVEELVADPILADVEGGAS
jgi:bidirectional [NiFe] hydrogenase diaphorase subunit